MSKEETMKLAQMLDALIQKYSDELYDGTGAKAANDFELDVAAIRLTLAEQPAPAAREWVGLTDEELDDLTAIYSGLPLHRAIEAKLRGKNHD